MPLSDLVETECGGNNSLTQFTSHYISDKGFAEEGIQHPFQNLKHEPGESTSERCFHMGTLLERIQNINVESNLKSEEQIRSHVEQEPIPSSSSLNQLSFSEISNESSNFGNLIQDDAGSFSFQELEQNELSGSTWNTNHSDRSLQHPHWITRYNQTPTTLFNQPPLITEQLNWFNPLEIPTYYPTGSNKLREAAGNVAHLMEADSIFSKSEFLNSMMELSGLHNAEMSNQNNNVRQDTEDEAEMNKTVRESRFDEFDDVRVLNTFGDEDTSSFLDADMDTFRKNLWSKLSEKWQMLTDLEDGGQLIGDSSYLQTAVDYKFCEENPMINCDDALKEGRKRLKMGDLSGAVLCFEAAVQKDKQNAEAWLLLGKTQAENEQDPKAITALSNCIKIDKGNLDALMTIAASFTNENYQYQACLALKQWLKHNPKYSYLIRNYEKENPKPDTDMPTLSSMMSQKFYKELKQLYEKAIFQQSYDGTIDADVQNGMGILYTLNNDHDKAAEYFKTAVREKNNDARLWNRLGATLANAQKAEQALEAYRNALTLSPGFIRARYNLGITCMHLNNYTDAIENLLTALNLQVSGRGLQGEKSQDMSDSIWGTLRLALSLSENRDLIPAAIQKNLNELNEKFGIKVNG